MSRRAESNLWQIDPDIGTVTYTYNGFGETHSARNARDIVTTYSYDLLGRVTEVSAEEGSNPADVTTYVYDVGIAESIDLRFVKREYPADLLLPGTGDMFVQASADLDERFHQAVLARHFLTFPVSLFSPGRSG